MPRLKIYMDWEGVVDRPSEYCLDTNTIYVNPVYYDHQYPSWMWFIPLTHEIVHWVIYKLPCTVPEVIGLSPMWIFHAKLEVLHGWLKDLIFYKNRNVYREDMSFDNWLKMQCPKCGSYNVKRHGCCKHKSYECLDCHHTWH